MPTEADAAWRQSPRGQLATRRAILKAYSITPDDYDRMLREQGGVCAACGSPTPGRQTAFFAVDHDHSCCPGETSCGRCIRGLLCARCNLILGYAHDDPAALLGLIDYLLAYAQRTATA